MLVKVVDRDGGPIQGASVKFFLSRKPMGSCVTGSTGTCHVLITPTPSAIKVSVDVNGLHKEQVVDADAGSFTFQFTEIEGVMTPKPTFMEFVRDRFALLTWIAFLFIAVALTFSIQTTVFQQRIILALFALGGAGAATELTGFLGVTLSFGKKLAIQAGGALAVFVILYLIVPPQ
jgi:hypothetical protein